MSTYTILDSQGNTLYEDDGDSLGEVVAAAVAAGTALNDAQLVGADLSNLDLTGGQFIGANLQGARIVRTNLTNANLRVANLTGADLSYSTVAGAELSSGSLSGVNLIGVDLLTANVVYGVTGGDAAYANSTVPAGNTIANATSGTFVSKYTIPANSLNVGDVVRITARGAWSATGVGPSVQVALGIGSVSVGGFDSGAMTTKPEDNGWSMSVDCVVLSTGVTANMECQGTCMFSLSDGTHIAQNIYIADPTAAEFDLTGPADITFAANWSAANAGNSVTLRQLIVEILKA